MKKDSLTGKKFDEISKRVQRDFAIHFDISNKGLPSQEEAAKWLENELVKYYSDLKPPELVEILTAVMVYLIVGAMEKARMMSEIMKHLHGFNPPPSED